MTRAPTARPPARILVVEDNAPNLALVGYLLAHRGHTVLTARHGAEALALLEAGERPDLVISDLQMPVLDGYALIERLRADPRHAGLPVIALTAFSMPNDRLDALDAGFDGYLSKPIEPEQFVDQVEAFLPPPRPAPGADVG
ncbi:response regulator [Piscinibacter sakaiensis]|uniref:Sensory box histidine kinase/response regulator n=1 Tax=Piscinibacter sakaiensis TaxID=1547922 RepID=A0A0K8NVL7_PISS1|nr:response regulator [Piscinibacter sakaiensis]GAP34423.1 sensory box histidine kinase/response regulator [Piscinibacter sakaiensis]